MFPTFSVDAFSDCVNGMVLSASTTFFLSVPPDVDVGAAGFDAAILAAKARLNSLSENTSDGSYFFVFDARRERDDILSAWCENRKDVATWTRDQEMERGRLLPALAPNNVSPTHCPLHPVPSTAVFLHRRAA